MRAARYLTLLLALAAPGAGACGHCIEDKIAAVYDHAVITQAQRERQAVMFYAIDGPPVVNDETRRALVAAVGAVPGIRPGSVRVSLELSALSAAYDPRRTNLAAAERALARKLKAKGYTLMLMRVLDEPAQSKAAAR